MADDDAFMEEDVAAGQDLEVGEKTGFIPAIVLKILKWVGLGLLAIIFIVTVVVLTVSWMNKGNVNQSVPTVSQEYIAKPPKLMWFNIDEMRVNTKDKPSKTVVIQVYLGWKEGDTVLQTELIARKVKIQDIIRTFFASRTAEEIADEAKMKRELLREINNIMSDGTVVDIVMPVFWIL